MRRYAYALGSIVAIGALVRSIPRSTPVETTTASSVCVASSEAGRVLVATNACIEPARTRVTTARSERLAMPLVWLPPDVTWTLESAPLDVGASSSSSSTLDALVVDFSLFPWPLDNAFHAASYVPRLYPSLALARALRATWRVVRAPWHAVRVPATGSLFDRLVALVLGDDTRALRPISSSSSYVLGASTLCARRLYVALANSRHELAYERVPPCNGTLALTHFSARSPLPGMNVLAHAMYRTCAFTHTPCTNETLLIVERERERRLLNADVLAAALGERARRVYFERMSLCEQMRRVWAARAIIGVHGAGLFAHTFVACARTGLVMLSHTPCECDESDYGHCFPGIKPGRVRVLAATLQLPVDFTPNRSSYHACIESVRALRSPFAPAAENGPGDVFVVNVSAFVRAVHDVSE